METKTGAQLDGDGPTCADLVSDFNQPVSHVYNIGEEMFGFKKQSITNLGCAAATLFDFATTGWQSDY